MTRHAQHRLHAYKLFVLSNQQYKSPKISVYYRIKETETANFPTEKMDPENFGRFSCQLKSRWLTKWIMD